MVVWGYIYIYIYIYTNARAAGRCYLCRLPRPEAIFADT